MATPTITVVGSANVDMITQLDRLPGVGDTVSGGKFMQNLGGKGANQAVAAARAGGEVSLIACLGDDAYAPMAIQSFRNDGIDTSGIIIRKGVPTGVALIMFDQQGRNCIAVASGANFAMTPLDIEAKGDMIREAAVVMMQNEISPQTAMKALDIAAAAHVPVVFNYAPVSEAPIPVTAKMNCLVVNEHEAAQLCGMDVKSVDQARLAALRLKEMGPAVVIVTLGPDGSYVVSRDQKAHVPPFKVKAVDTTAAGDTFCGALAVGLLEDMSLLHAVRFATAASAISVTRAGAQPSIPRREEINRFLEERQQVTV